MAINIRKFSPRPGLVNKQGHLPDPTELVCVEVPKVFDQCLIKRCLRYECGPDTVKTDCELRSNPLEKPKKYIGCRDFKIDLIKVDKEECRGNHQGYKKVVIMYMISFYADYLDCDGNTKSELFEINRTDVLGKFYCPDCVSEMSSSADSYKSDEKNGNIIKLEMVATALCGELLEDDDDNCVLDITLGYYIVVKCEIITQLLIPAYDYCPVPKEPCDEEPEEDPCEKFEKAPIPKFYPKQHLEPLFVDIEDECDCDFISEDDEEL